VRQIKLALSAFGRT